MKQKKTVEIVNTSLSGKMTLLVVGYVSSLIVAPKQIMVASVRSGKVVDTSVLTNQVH